MNTRNAKKWTFALAVLAASMVPMAAEAKAYTTLDWIRGQSGAYIKSGYTPKSTDKIEVTLLFVDTSTTYGIFCARGSQTTTTSFTMFLVNQKLRIDHGNGTEAQTTSTFTPANNTKYVVVADGNTQEFLVDGTSYATMYDETFTPGSEMIFLASWTVGKTPNNYATDVKLYGVRIWDASGALMCDFVPATYIRFQCQALKVGEKNLACGGVRANIFSCHCNPKENGLHQMETLEKIGVT